MIRPDDGDTRPERVAVIIVNYNGGAMLRQCIDALDAQTVRGFQTIVVDNASSDDSVAFLSGRPSVDLVRSGCNLGFAAGNNLGLRHAGDAKWIVLLNPDAFPESTWLEALLAAARRSPEFAFFGCKMRLADASGRLDGTGDLHHVSGVSWRRDHGCPESSVQRGSGEIFGPCAAAAMYSRGALNEVAGFDESYFCYHEDVDLAFRLRLLGYRCLYVPDSIVRHVSSGIAGRRSDFATYHGQRNLVWTFVKDMPGVLFWLYLPMHVAVNVAAVLVCATRGQLVVALRAKRDALIGLPMAWRARRSIQARRRVHPRGLLQVLTRGLRPLLSRGGKKS